MEILRPSSSETGQNYLHQTPAQSNATAPASVRKAHLDLEELYCILQLEPYDSVIALELGRRLRGLGKLDQALRVLRNVLKIDSRYETLSELAAVEYELDMIDASFEHLQHAMLIAPENGAILFEVFKTLGNIFVRKGDLDSAEDSYNKAHRLNPGSDVLQVNLGTLAIQRQLWDEALERFRSALALNQANDKAWVGLALCHRVKGDLELAWGNIQAALEYGPLNETAVGLALDWGAHDGREEKALALIRNYLIEGGWSERLSLAFAYLSFRRGEGDKARLELERLLAVNPENVQALSLLNEIRKSS